MTENKPRVVAVIPCYNTAPHIAGVVTKSLPYVDQVIVVDDGSTDDTAAIARAAGAVVMTNGHNRGYGEAIQSCFKKAQAVDADILVILDGDGQHDPDYIPEILKPIKENNADISIGSRFLTTNCTTPFHRHIGINIITILWNIGSKVTVTDSQSGFRAYNKNVLNTICLTEGGMGASIEVLEIARRKGLNMVEVPISCRYFSSSITLKSITHGLSVAFSTMRIRLKYQFAGINK